MEPKNIGKTDVFQKKPWFSNHVAARTKFMDNIGFTNVLMDPKNIGKTNIVKQSMLQTMWLEARIHGQCIKRETHNAVSLIIHVSAFVTFKRALRNIKSHTKHKYQKQLYKKKRTKIE